MVTGSIRITEVDSGAAINGSGNKVRVPANEDDRNDNEPSYEVIGSVTNTDTDTSTSASEESTDTETAIDPANITPRKPRKKQTPEEAKKSAEKRWQTRRANEANGATQKTTSKADSLPDTAYDEMLVAIHCGVAALLSVKELEIDTDDAALLRSKFGQFSDAMGWKPQIVSPKIAASVNLVMALTAVYGPRLQRVNARIQEQKKNGPKLVQRVPQPSPPVSN